MSTRLKPLAVFYIFPALVMLAAYWWLTFPLHPRKNIMMLRELDRQPFGLSMFIIGSMPLIALAGLLIEFLV